MSLRRPIAWLRSHPAANDWIVAAVLLAVSVPALWYVGKRPRFVPPDVWAVLLTVVVVVPLAWRRQRPALVLVVSATAYFVSLVIGYPAGAAFLAVSFGVYSYACHRANRADVWPVLLWVAEMFLLIPLGPWFAALWGRVAVLIALAALAWGVGDAVRARRLERHRLAEQAEYAERERQARARQAIADERALIAREIHDVVAHALGVVVMLSSGAGRLRNLDVPRARESLAGIESTSRQAFAEMRRLVSGLREEGSQAELAPQPAISDIPALVDALRDAGLKVSLTVCGAPGSLPSGVELSAYRIVQEALTNAVRHAPGAAARVTLTWTPTTLDIEVANDAPPDRPPTRTIDGLTEGGAHGIVGMRERALLFGGRFSAEPSPGGGFHVCASLPVVFQS